MLALLWNAFKKFKPLVTKILRQAPNLNLYGHLKMSGQIYFKNRTKRFLRMWSSRLQGSLRMLYFYSVHLFSHQRCISWTSKELFLIILLIIWEKKNTTTKKTLFWLLFTWYHHATSPPILYEASPSKFLYHGLPPSFM